MSDIDLTIFTFFQWINATWRIRNTIAPVMTCMRINLTRFKPLENAKSFQALKILSDLYILV